MSPWLAAWVLPARLAWRQLRHEPARLAAALSGVLFACLLIFMQLGFQTSLLDSAVTPQAGMQADLYMLHRQTEALWRTQPFARTRLMQALGVPGVERVVPMHVGNAAWKNPETSLKRTLLVLGTDPDGGLLAYAGLDQAAREAIRRADVVLFDEASRPVFGPVAQLLAQGPLFVELADRRVEVAGMFRIGATFGTEGHVLTSETNFMRLFPGRTPGHVDLGAIFLAPGADPASVKAALAPLLGPDVMVMTHAEMVAFELRYWSEVAPIGFIFGLGVMIGLVVGSVIVYQILFSDIARHLGEYATLKAMGYPNIFLARVVMGAALILAVGGYVPGWFAAWALYALATEQIFIPMTLDLGKSVLVFVLVFGMCVVSGLLAIRKLRDANPADMF